MDKLIKFENQGVTLSPDTISQIIALETQMKEIKKTYDNFKAQLLAEMEANMVLKIDTPELLINYIAETDRESFDSKKFRAEHPELYDAYVEMKPVKACVKIKVR